jgi:hypothetical protein
VKFVASVDEKEMYCIDAYYDRVFGTFAFKRVPLQTSPAISGGASDASGQAMPFEEVTLRIAGREFSTHTDGQGRYAFRAAHIPAGAGSLTIGDTTRQVRLQKGVTLNCDLALSNSVSLANV